MADHCGFCDTRRPTGGTNMLVLNGGEVWLEFCKSCGEDEVLTNGETGEEITVAALFERNKPKEEPRKSWLYDLI